ncbi:PLP-dependent aminotransferase family protein [Paenibacillus campi]|uniref:MocR-like pyridoxine biosynthesis transcription factor PdxR n=1 Tax=Paenibacillus campi TaxID=3106031 RepID=UPI002AFF6E42|nr:PLP-dependent aminotransferase family protein [Paenibacillus sp. SGZ-1014]
MWGIQLQHESQIALARQIFLSFQQAILGGKMLAGEALPSTRELARELGVARNTVCEAYDMLDIEGFIIRRQGAATRVASGLTLEKHIDHAAHKRDNKRNEQRSVRWDFKTGQPDLDAFPWYSWRQDLQQAALAISPNLLAYSDNKGYEPLCEQIADWLLRSRSMDVNPANIFITSGATQAFQLLVHILQQEGKAFALESPSHPAIRQIVENNHIPLVWMPVDAQGANVAALHQHALSAVYVTPSHQFPLGVILPAARRAELIRMARSQHFYIIEDDYDSEFRYTGSPVSPLYSMDRSKVIYVGTFSKTLFPALRIGFVILPQPLHALWRENRKYLDVQNPVMEQVALHHFVQQRKLDRHIQRMRRIYREKRNALLAAIDANFPVDTIIWGDASGLHTAIELPGLQLDDNFLQRCHKQGIRLKLASDYCLEQGEHRDKLLIGYGHLQQEQIIAGIGALGRLIRKENDRL